MRTKALLLSAALVAAGVATSMAQSNVYSLNIVGYVNVPVQANKFYLLENPLDTGNGNVVTNVLPFTDPNFDSTLVYTFSASTGLNPVETYIGGFGWFPGTNVLAPGTGFYLYPTTNTTVTFTGSVTLASTNHLAPGFTMDGSPYPASLSLTALGLTGVDSDLVYRYDPNAGLNDISTYIGGYGWFETINNNPAGGTGGSTNGPTLNVGEGFFYYNANSTFNWVQNFTVN